LKCVGNKDYTDRSDGFELKGDHSLVAHTAWAYVPVFGELDELRKRGIPIAEYNGRKDVRNVLVLPLQQNMGDSNCLGVLKVENKLPKGKTQFNRIDLEVCREFVQKQIAPTIQAKYFSKQHSKETVTEGLKFLINKTGYTTLKIKDFKKSQDFRKLVQEVRKLQKKKDEIKLNDCLRFLYISKGHYYELVKNPDSHKTGGKS